MKLALASLGSEAIEQFEPVHVNVGPEVCVNDTKVVALGVESASVTFVAGSGP